MLFAFFLQCISALAMQLCNLKSIALQEAQMYSFYVILYTLLYIDVSSVHLYYLEMISFQQ